MLDAPRLLLVVAREPLYVLRFPLPMALRLLPGRDMSRPPMRSGPLVAGARFAAAVLSYPPPLNYAAAAALPRGLGFSAHSILNSG